MSDPQSAFVAALQRAAGVLLDAQQQWIRHPEVVDPLVAGTDGPPFREPWDASVLAFARWARMLATHVQSGMVPHPDASAADRPPECRPSDAATAFVAALGRAALALAAAEACWAEHPHAVDAVLEAAAYPAGLPSFDDFTHDFLAWVEALAERHAAQQATPSALARRSTYQGPAAQAAAKAGPPFGPGWDAETAGRITRFEIWGTSFIAPEDYCEFHGFAGAWLIRAERLPGY